MGVTLTNHFLECSTQVPNRFIDEYMPHANGSFVKVYLYLLRQMSSGTTTLTIESMADMLSNTEADILRALHYWEKQGILSISAKDGQPDGICLLPFPEDENSVRHFVRPASTKDSIYDRRPESKAEQETAATKVTYPEHIYEPDLQHTSEPDLQHTSELDLQYTSEPDLQHTSEPDLQYTSEPDLQYTSEPELPKRHTYSPLQAEALKKDEEIDACLSMVEALLGTTMGDAHMQLVLYLMSDLGFSSELVITLYETALSRGKNKTAYLEAIALDWAKKGIRTAKEALEEASSFNGTYKLVSSALGIRRALAPAEKRIIDKWEKYHFADPVIEEACSRTVLQSGDTNLNYTSKILEDWHKKGVTCLKDIDDCDKSYFRQKAASAQNNNRASTAAKNKFQNFPQREYSQKDYADLEKQLLHQ
ncbi:MAG: DnaD domain protein [Eubacterium sp.]|jgi:DnaD/phage-associated family protein|nr:DnaD domain protein [Eubacterium sp.]